MQELQARLKRDKDAKKKIISELVAKERQFEVRGRGLTAEEWREAYFSATAEPFAGLSGCQEGEGGSDVRARTALI